MDIDQGLYPFQDQTQSLGQRISLKATIDQHEALELNNHDLAEFVQGKVNENDYLEYRFNSRWTDTPPWRTSKLDGYGGIANKPRADRTQNHYSMLQNVAAPEYRTPSLRNHLLRQLPDLEVDLKSQGVHCFDRKFAEFLISEITSDNADQHSDTSKGIGMLPRPLVELRMDYEKVFEEVTSETAQETLEQLQKNLTPPGVGAETETQRVSLLLQRAADPIGHDQLGLDQPLQYVSELHQIVNNHLDELKTRRFDFIADAIGMTNDRLIDEVLPELRRLLSTRSYDKFLSSQPGIVPEVVVRFTESGELDASANNPAIPQIRVAKQYLAETNVSKELRRCINSDGQERTKFDEARRLVTTITWRGSILKLLAEELIQLQGNYFRYGPKHLTLLSQRDLAKSDRIRALLEPSRFEELNQIKSEIASANDSTTRRQSEKHLAQQEEKITKLLESRISRALKDKWMETPHGIYPMKDCFLDNPTWVKRHMLDIIMGESKLTPYSDEQLKEELRKYCIDLKPDTIRKYRKKLGFDAANKRRVRSAKRLE